MSAGAWRVERETRLDILVADLMGSTDAGTVEAVLTANPGLADVGPAIPIGTVVVAPERPAPVPVGRRIWE